MSSFQLPALPPSHEQGFVLLLLLLLLLQLHKLLLLLLMPFLLMQVQVYKCDGSLIGIGGSTT